MQTRTGCRKSRDSNHPGIQAAKEADDIAQAGGINQQSTLTMKSITLQKRSELSSATIEFLEAQLSDCLALKESHSRLFRSFLRPASQDIDKTTILKRL
jgi:hypothetical protein